MVDSAALWLGESVLEGIKALFQIALLSYLIYQLVRAVRGTRAAPALFGVLLLVALHQICGWLGLTTLHWMLEQTGPYAGVALIVIFQRELRGALREMALQFVPKSRKRTGHSLEYEDVVFAVNQLSQSRVGALIVIERETGLRTFIQSGVALDSRLTADLLVSIFQRSAPLHDGGVIIQGDRVAAASCFLPLTTNPGLVSSLGTRHRAAIGITEESDAVALVVSETDGRVSFAVRGEIESGLSADRLRLRMIERLGPVVVLPKGKPISAAADQTPVSTPEQPSVEAREVP